MKSILDESVFYRLAVHIALTAIQDQLRPGEYVVAFLDDIYVVSLPERTRAIFNLVAEKLDEGAGVELHAGKTRVWNRAGDCPPEKEELGPDVWNAAGIKIQGTPVGTADFEHEICAARLAEEDKLWKAIKWIPAGRSPMPPLFEDHAAISFRGVCGRARCGDATSHGIFVGRVARRRQQEVATQIASLPMRMGGLGIRSASRMAPSSFWASWADALPMLQDRLPSISNQIADVLDGAQAPGCLGELQTTTQVLDRNGFISRPGWRALQGGARPPHQHGSEPGEWPHGWQYFASSASEHHFRETVVLAQSCAADQAHLRSHSGAGSSDVLCGCPTGREFKILPTLFRTIVSERLRLPFQLTESSCECGAALDKCGRHRGACPRSGRLKSRATAPGRTLARVCREAGGSVRTHVKLRDLNTSVPEEDDRSVEVLTSGLPMHHGAQLAVDITLRSAVTSFGAACPNASTTSTVNGAVLERARGGQREQRQRAVGWPQVPFGCGGARNGWSMERRIVEFHRVLGVWTRT